MTRARVAALALVNWKGVFYERYLLDRHVTALEGANGAGKTTVMIAAYMVLLPDMTRVRFTNLGESGATGGDRGIWGRLGELGRPSYAVLDLELAEERVVLAVRLTRAAEPSVELTAFMITGLAAERALSEIFLVRREDGDHIPELDEIKAQVARAQAEIEVFRTTKDYFAALFERGITPLRLTGESERAKWNDLLRTSMTGGISRALGSELRGFLLREETGLAGTLARMRDNLDACRRTRLEVLESRQLEREISANYEAGQAMFGLALHAARLADVEARQRTRLAQERCELAERQLAELEAQRTLLAAQEEQRAQDNERLRETIVQLTAARERAQAAGLCAVRVEDLGAEADALARAAAAELEAQRTAAAQRETLRAARARALEAYDRASLGLLNRQQGLDELNLRAHSYKQLQRSLRDARVLLARPELDVADAEAALASLDEQRTTNERARGQLERAGRHVAERQAEYTRARALLDELAHSSLFEGLLVPEHEHERARVLLARCSELAMGQEQLPRLEREQAEAQRLAGQQQDARKLALSLELQVGTPDAAEAVVEALQAAETALLAVEAEQRQDAQAQEERLELLSARERLSQLELDSARYQGLRAAAARLESERALDTHAALLALRDSLILQQVEWQQRSVQLETESDQLQLQAAELTRGGAVYDVELLRLRDELGAELLASRFEDLEPGQASWVEARLGPLVQALVVEDPVASAAELDKLEHGLPAVHLVRAGALLELSLSAADSGETRLVCEEHYGVRVVPLPATSSLGRRAREHKLAQLRAAITEHAARIEQLATQASEAAGRRRDSELLLAQAELWLAGDPARQKLALDATVVELERRTREQHEREQRARAQGALLRARISGLRRLLPSAQLLPAPDYGERARELAGARIQLSAARGELARLASTQKELAQLVEVLRTPPPDERALAHMQAELVELDARLAHAYRARTALEEVLHQRHAVTFADAEAALSAEQTLSPALEAQHTAARADLAAAEQAEAAAAISWEQATAARQAVDARVAVAVAQRDRAELELRELGGAPAHDALETTTRQLAYAGNELTQLEAAARISVAERALADERHTRAGHDLEAFRERLTAERAAAEPLDRAWQSLRSSAEQAGVLHQALAQPPPSGSSVQLAAAATSKRQILFDRVQRSRGGGELLPELEAAPGYLEAWLSVRAFLGRRVPAHVAEVLDPLLALERLRDHLQMLELRLGRQEGDLRGSSEDVARGIEVQLRRAHSQVRRLNQQLEGIHFGSVHGIRIELRRIERMEQILRALREGQAQDLLFSANMPIEEALDEIFKRYAGGGRGAGQKLLDYREYIELAVEVRRQTGAAWEPANPTRLSTGEAIGVGAALMMVVLTQWEWDAILLRPRGALGSIRFLFLDEANRLSRDNLGVLFDLCRSLELQLLVAAPEVARADGNTTYRLVRHTTDSGSEEVIVSGRRAVPSALTEPVTDPEEVANAPSELEVVVVTVENVC